MTVTRKGWKMFYSGTKVGPPTFKKFNGETYFLVGTYEGKALAQRAGKYLKRVGDVFSYRIVSEGRIKHHLYGLN